MRDPVWLFRRHLRRAFRHYLYGSLTVLLIYLIFRWLLSPSSPQKRFIDIDRMPSERLMQPEVVSSKPEDSVMAPTVENTVSLEIYIESQCPDTTHFMRKQFYPAWQKLSGTGRVDLKVIPFGKARCTPRDDDFSCQCQHGPGECELNQLMNCVIEEIGFPEKYVPIVNCIQGKWDMEQTKRECLSSQPQLPVNKLMECATGPRGRRLLAVSGQKTAGLQPPLDFVPWIIIDGERSVDAMYDLREIFAHDFC